MAGQGRHHGAVQTDMANALGVQHRNFFYVLKVSWRDAALQLPGEDYSHVRCLFADLSSQGVPAAWPAGMLLSCSSTVLLRAVPATHPMFLLLADVGGAPHDCA
jgi:hypothetical protein